MKLFGREPTLWISVLTAIVILLGTFGFDLLNGQQAALIVVAINAIAGAATAWMVRPISPVAFTYSLGSILAVAGSYGLELPAESVAALNALVVPILALLTRDQVTPQETRLTRA